MIKKLIVVSHVEVDIKNKELKNHRALQEIINSYLVHFDEIHYIGPGIEDSFFIDGGEKIIYHSIEGFLGSNLNKLLFSFKFLKNKVKYKKLVSEIDTQYVQLRFPSFFSMPFKSIINKNKIAYTTYVAGDVEKVYAANYNFIGKSFLIKLMKLWENKCVENSLCVTTGSTLAKEYSKIAETHAFLSTVHNKVERIEKIERNKILFVGRLEAEKRVKDLIDAIHLLTKDKIDVKLEIVGSGSLKNELKKQVKDLKLEKEITFIGKVSSGLEMEKHYEKSAILVLPSITEGTPKVLPEGMAFGVVPISSRNVGSINEILGEDERGLLIIPKSSKDIAKKIKKLIENENLYNKLQNKAYQYAEEHTLDNEVKKMFNFIFSKNEVKIK